MEKSTKAVTFDGGSGSGAVGSVAYFTVTGEVLAALTIPFCTGSLTEAASTATIVLGVTGDTDLFMGATMNATALDNGQFMDANGGSPQGIANGIQVDALQKDVVITDNIILTVGSQNVNGGTLRVDVYWMPLSSDGKVAAA